MSDPIVEKKDVVTPATEEKKPDGTAKETPPADPSQDPVKAALDKVKKPKTEAEKAAYTLKMNAKRVKELGIDPFAIIGEDEDPTDDIDDEKPVTHGDMKRIEREKAAKEAVSLANEIADEAERELTIHHLQNTIKPSGNPQQDLANARSIVNGVKNSKIAEEMSRKSQAKPSAPGGSTPGKHEEKFEPTPHEQSLMKPPFNLTKDEVIKARKAEKA